MLAHLHTCTHMLLLRVAEHGPGDLQAHVSRALSAVLDVRWPSPRWPLHTFTSGACLCLLTSSLCHLFGCCSWHISQVSVSGRSRGKTELGGVGLVMCASTSARLCRLLVDAQGSHMAVGSLLH